jgi:predicted secreted protein
MAGKNGFIKMFYMLLTEKSASESLPDTSSDKGVPFLFVHGLFVCWQILCLFCKLIMVCQMVTASSIEMVGGWFCSEMSWQVHR